MNFDDWKSKVNSLCEKEFGLDTDHFPDYHWHDDWHCEFTPAEAFDNAKEIWMEEY